MTAADNLSRLKVLRVETFILVIGSLFLYFSRSMLIVCMMLFFVGFSIYPICKVLQAIISEQVDELLMKKFMAICLLTAIIVQILIGPIF